MLFQKRHISILKHSKSNKVTMQKTNEVFQNNTNKEEDCSSLQTSFHCITTIRNNDEEDRCFQTHTSGQGVNTPPLSIHKNSSSLSYFHCAEPFATKHLFITLSSPNTSSWLFHMHMNQKLLHFSIHQLAYYLY